MPNIQTTKTGGVITWDQDDWIGGLTQKYTVNPFTVKQIGSLTGTLAYSNNMNPYINLGYAAPGFLASDIANASSATGTLLNLTTSAGNAYCVSSDEKFQKIIPGTATLSTVSPYPHSIVGAGIHAAHTTFKGLDVIAYKANITTNNEKVFYAYKDNTDWGIGKHDVVAGTFDEDFMSSAPVNASDFSGIVAAGKDYPHPLHINQRDIMLIGDRNFVHEYDGQTGSSGTFSKDVLILPNDWIITSFAPLGQHTMIFAYKSTTPTSGTLNFTEAKAWLWDNLSRDISEVYDLNDNYVIGARAYRDTVICLTSGRSDTSDPLRVGKLQKFNGVGFDVVRPFSPTSATTFPVAEGGVDVGSTGQITWNSQGIIHTWGSNYPELPQRLNRLASGQGTTNGVLRNLSVNFMLNSSGVTTTGGAENLSVNTGKSATATLITNLAIPPFPEEKIGEVTYVKVFFGATATGGRSVKIAIKDRLNNESIVLTGVEEVAAGNLTRRFEQDTSGANFITFDALKCDIDWSAGSGSGSTPIIDKIEVGYQLRSINAT